MLPTGRGGHTNLKAGHIAWHPASSFCQNCVGVESVLEHCLMMCEQRACSFQKGVHLYWQVLRPIVSGMVMTIA